MSLEYLSWCICFPEKQFTLYGRQWSGNKNFEFDLFNFLLNREGVHENLKFIEKITLKETKMGFTSLLNWAQECDNNSSNSITNPGLSVRFPPLRGSCRKWAGDSPYQLRLDEWVRKDWSDPLLSTGDQLVNLEDLKFRILLTIFKVKAHPEGCIRVTRWAGLAWISGNWVDSWADKFLSLRRTDDLRIQIKVLNRKWAVNTRLKRLRRT